MPAEAGEKTEPPTPKRRSEARQKGQIARSQDLTAAVMVTSGFFAIKIFGPGLWNGMLAVTRAALAPSPHLDEREVRIFAEAVAFEAFKMVLPILLVLMAAGLMVLYAQVGWLFTLKPITPSLTKLNPINGIKRIISPRSFVTALINVAKLIVVGAVAYWTLMSSAPELLHAYALGFRDVFLLGTALAWDLILRLAAVMLLLAIIDYFYQRYRHERDLKMTKEEVKDEMRSMEGDPVIKRRRRQAQMQLAMQRVGQEVPKADVVVTNPTHLAIAIRYDSDDMVAPVVVAKGGDYMALRIRQIAQMNGIPIVERKALVRVMYDVVEVGQSIPERFYQAIAEILAYVYELTGRSLREPEASIA